METDQWLDGSHWRLDAWTLFSWWFSGRAVQGYCCGAFLTDSEPGCIAWSDLDDVQSFSEQTETPPFDVWVSSVGASH